MYNFNIKFELALGKYIFEIKILEQVGHDVKLDPDEKRSRSDLKNDELKKLKYFKASEMYLL
eukprot:snap_masked-scaffold_4-processed-gene-18.23-mRNA-1 protein AED:1.00 eAED:1.00 QI:0/0/0/0/1/1/2/0/61